MASLPSQTVVTQSHKSTALRNRNKAGKVANPVCPGCGATRPVRSLLVCRSCWLKLPEYVRLEAYNRRKTDPKSCQIGDTAIQVMVALGKARKAQ